MARLDDGETDGLIEMDGDFVLVRDLDRDGDLDARALACWVPDPAGGVFVSGFVVDGTP